MHLRGFHSNWYHHRGCRFSCCLFLRSAMLLSFDLLLLEVQLPFKNPCAVPGIDALDSGLCRSRVFVYSPCISENRQISRSKSVISHGKMHPKDIYNILKERIF